MSDYSIRPAELLASEVREWCGGVRRFYPVYRTEREDLWPAIPNLGDVQIVHATRYEIADTLEEMVRMKRRNYRPDCLCLSCRVLNLAAALRASALDGATDPTYGDEP